jgi:elongation factor P
MIEAAQLRKGTVIDIDGELYEVAEYELKKIGRGGANVKTKLRALERGASIDRTFGSNERLNDVRLETRRVQYLYNDGDLYHFMDNETFEQPALTKEAVADVEAFLIDGIELSLAMHEGRAIKIELPVTVDLEVIEAPPAHKGDTASGASKPVKLSNGMMVTVPMFIDAGTVVRIDTRTGAYVTRVTS